MTSNYLRHAILTLSNQTSRYIKSELEFLVIAEPETFIDREGGGGWKRLLFFCLNVFLQGEEGRTDLPWEAIGPEGSVCVWGGGGGGAYHYF